MKRPAQKIAIVSTVHPDAIATRFDANFPTDETRYSGKVNPDDQVSLFIYSPLPEVREALEKFPLSSVWSVNGKLRLNLRPSAALRSFVEANRANLSLVVLA